MHEHGTTPNEFFPHLIEKLNDGTLTDAEFRDFVRKNTEEVHHLPELHLSRYGFDGVVSGPQAAISWLHGRIEKGEC